MSKKPFLYQAEVLFDYEAVESTELSVTRGQVVGVREVNESGWCLVKVDGRSGWIPLDYIEKIESSEGTPQPQPIPQPVPVPEPVPEPITFPAQPQPQAQPQVQLPSAPAVAPKPAEAEIPPEAVADLAKQLQDQLNATPTDNPREICHSCKQRITDRFVVAKDKVFHVDHFVCTTCKQSLAAKPFIEKDGDFFCENDFYAKFNPPCGACTNVIKGSYITALGQAWHPDCFVCTECRKPFTGNQFRKHDDKPYCDEHYNKLFGASCTKCNSMIDGQIFEALGKKFHLQCFTCEVGAHPIGENSTFHVYDDKVYCPNHFEDMFLQKCSSCGKTISSQYVKIGENHYHPECWKCANCSTVIDRTNCEQYMSQFVCQDCYTKMVAQTKPTMKAAPSAPTQSASSVPSAPSASSSTQSPGDSPPAAPPVAADKPKPTAPPSNTTLGALTGAPVRKVSTSAPPDPNSGTASFANYVASAAAKRQAAASISESKQKSPAAEVKVVSPPPVDGETFLTYAGLKNPDGLPSWVDPSKKEQYLSPDQFERLFKMSKAEFAQQKLWKQQKLKKDLGLF